MHPNRKERALEAAQLLNLFVGDLGAARQGFSLTEKAMDVSGLFRLHELC